jgi:hypothetical protein
VASSSLAFFAARSLRRDSPFSPACVRCRQGGRARHRQLWDRRASWNATTLDRRVAQVRVVDPHHLLHGKCFPVSTTLGTGTAVIVIQLPDGRERGISRLATAPAIWWRQLRVVRCTFRCARCCLWRITCVLCSPPDMRISKEAADETSIRWWRSDPGSAATPVATATRRDTASAGTARATPATAARPLRGGSSC